MALSDSLQGGLSQVSGNWSKATPIQKAGAGFGLAAILGVIFFFLLSGEKINQKYLFTDMSEEDVTAITAFFKKQNYENYTIDKNGLKVAIQDVDRLRLALSQEGLPYKGIIGWEKFDSSDFTRTEFEQEINRLRAIQGELSRTISSIDGISSARVHIVLPKASLFIRDKKEPSASIYISTRRGFELESKQVRGIQHMVSKAVADLKPNNIAILDSKGQLLTDIETKDEAVKQSKELLNYKNNIEKTMEERIRAIVGKVVGPDRIEAKVDAQVDFTQEKQVISDVDPDRFAVVSKNTQGFSMSGQGLNPTGIPGAKSNVPGEKEQVQGATSKAGSKKDTELINYEIAKKVSHKTLAIGNITRLTVSAIIDGKQAYPLDGSTPEFEARTPEEMKKIEELIKDSVGFIEKRDSLTVHNMMFQLDPFQVMAIKKQKKADREYISTLAMSAVVALAIILFFAFIVRPYFRWLTYDPERKVEESIIEEYKPDLELGTMQNVQVKEEVPFEQMTPKEQVMYLAKNEPKRTTEAIRMMLNPTGSSGG